MAEVDVGTETYEVYADLDTADLYAGAALHGTTYRDASNDDKGRALTTATRTLDRQRWKGVKTDELQTLAWPRTNTGVEGVDVDEVPLNIINASIELAFALLDGSEVQNQQTTAERVRSMSAGSVSISHFRGIDNPTRFPLIVQELIRDYLAGSLGVDEGFYATAEGIDDETSFPVEAGYLRGIL